MSSSPLQDVYALRKKCVDQLQLPTPHPSSSTQCAPSSPGNGYRARVLPSIQYARPSMDGHWFCIGRSSASNDLALPSNNRLVSRTHAKIRYIAAENALEVKCIGYNGISLCIADQTMYIRRNTGVMVQIHEDCEIGLDIAGSLVDIEVPTTCQSEEQDVLAPSSPSMPATELKTSLDVLESTEQIKQDDQQQSIRQIEPLSPLPSSTGMVTPSITPNVYRIRTDEPESSPEEVHEIHLAPPEDQDEDEGEDTSQHEALQPRKLDFSNISHSNAQPTSKADLQGVGKENIPPEENHTEHDSYENIFDTSADELTMAQPKAVQLTEVKQGLNVPVAEFVVDAECVTHAFEPEPVMPETRQDDAQPTKDNQADIEAPADLAEIDESPVKTANVKAIKAATETCLAARESLETTANKTEEFDFKQLDQEFIDMILTVLATSVISPAPISLLTPFFPPETDGKAIESFLRTQSCITELVLRNELSVGDSQESGSSSSSSSSSSWSYDPRNDTDLVRRARLAQLQKPQRTLRKRTYQQMHTYEYEHAKYVMDCKAAGIKPVRFDGVRYRGTHSSQSKV